MRFWHQIARKCCKRKATNCRADEDAAYAQQIIKEEMLKKNEETAKEEDDEKLAKQILRQEMEQLHRR